MAASRAWLEPREALVQRQDGGEQVAELLLSLERLVRLEDERLRVAASATSSTSSHRSGVETVGRSRARSE